MKNNELDITKIPKNIPLTIEFFQTSFTPGYLDQVKHLSKSKNVCWISIPPGDDKTHENVPDHLQTGPLVKYRQTEGEKYCLVYSFASTLEYLGLHQISSEIYQAANVIVEKHNTFHLFTTSLNQKSKHLIHQKFKKINEIF